MTLFPHILFRFLFILTYTFSFAFAQDNVVKSTEKTEIGGRIFYIHFVEKGHTLYAISRVYDVSPEEIKKANPSKIEGNTLIVGTSIKIPVKVVPILPEFAKSQKVQIGKKYPTLYTISKKFNVPVSVLVAFNSGIEQNSLALDQEVIVPLGIAYEGLDITNYYYHLVQKKETLYGLTKKYQVSSETIRKYNNFIVNSAIKQSMLIKIPRKVDTVEVVDSSQVLSTQEQELWGENDTLQILVCVIISTHQLLGDSTVRPSFSPREKEQFYFIDGISTALEELTEKKINSRLKILKYDGTDQDLRNKLAALNTPLHFTVTPTQHYNYKVFQEYANEKKTATLDLFTRIERATPYMLHNRLDADSLFASYLRYVGQSTPSNKLIVMHGKDTGDSLVERTIRKLTLNYTPLPHPLDARLKRIIHKETSDTGFIIPPTYNETLYDIIFESMDDVVLFAPVLTKQDISEAIANAKRIDATHNVHFFGFSSWLSLPMHSIDDYFQIHFSFLTNSYLNPQKREVQLRMEKAYEKKHQREMNEKHWEGYDLINYLAPIITDAKSYQWSEKFEPKPYYGLSCYFQFVPSNQGYINNGLLSVEMMPDYTINVSKFN